MSYSTDLPADEFSQITNLLPARPRILKLGSFLLLFLLLHLFALTEVHALPGGEYYWYPPEPCSGNLLTLAPIDSLFCAARNGNLELVRAKLEVVSPNDLNNSFYPGTGPLTEAIINRRKKVVFLLLQAGADVNIMDKDGNTPLMFASSRTIAQLLIDAGADVNALNKRQQTPLSINFRSKKMVRILLWNGADIYRHRSVMPDSYLETVNAVVKEQNELRKKALAKVFHHRPKSNRWLNWFNKPVRDENPYITQPVIDIVTSYLLSR